MTATTNNLTAKIEFLKGAYVGMEENNSLRTFMSVGRDALQAEWFSARGIYDKFEKDYRAFFKDFFTSGSQVAIDLLFNEQFIDSFAEALYKKISGFPDAEKAAICEAAKKAVNGNVLFAGLRNGIKIVETAPVVAPVAVAEVAPVAEVEVAKTETVIERKKEKVNANFNLMLPLNELIDSAVVDYIENESGILAKVEQRIKDEAAKLRPNVIQIGERKTVEIKGRLHNTFNDALELAILERQIFIAGEAGTGKTTLAEQIATAMQLKFGHISCTAGMSEAHLLGRMDAHGNYLQSQFVDIYENGGVFLFDEVDAADSNTMLIINSALANGKMSVPNRKDNPTAKRHEDFICVCAANTWGFGSNEYAGRNILDAAFLDRFTGSRLVVGYDLELEAEMSKEFPEVAVAIWKIRNNVKLNKIRRVVSTRAIISGVRQRMAGKTLEQYINRFLTGWTAEEINKAKAGVI